MEDRPRSIKPNEVKVLKHVADFLPIIGTEQLQDKGNRTLGLYTGGSDRSSSFFAGLEVGRRRRSASHRSWEALVVGILPEIQNTERRTVWESQIVKHVQFVGTWGLSPTLCNLCPSSFPAASPFRPAPSLLLF